MTETLIQPLLGLDKGFPEKFYVFVDGNKFLCYCYKGLHGLACFENLENAENYKSSINIKSLVIQSVTFEEARKIAKNRPDPIICLLLLDDLTNPEIHYVK